MKKHELVVLAMYLLDGGDKALDIEDVAVKSTEISPGAFAWKKYKDQINLELVGFAVRDAKKEKYGAFVIGNHASGWRLSPAGVKRGKELFSESQGLKNIEVGATRDNSIQAKRINSEAKRLFESEAFLDWQKKKKTSNKLVAKLLKINTYSSQELVDIKISRLSKLRGMDAEVDSFLDYIESVKGEIL
jgi:hypothetical protein